MARKTPPKSTWHMEYFTFDQLNLPAWQRHLNDRRVVKLVKTFDEDRAQVPYIACVDGEYLILDGQHQIEARRRLEQEGVWANTKVMTYEEAGWQFRRFNTDPVRLSNFDDWEAGREIHDPEVAAIDKTMEGLGLRVAAYSSPTTVACIWHLKMMYAVKGGGVKHISTVIGLADEAWHGQDQVFRGEIVAAISQIIRKYDGKLDRAKAVRSWGKDFTPQRLLMAARDRNFNEGQKKENAISALLVKSHDARLSVENKLRPAGGEEF